MCVAPAVAFATGGATLSTLTGLPYLVCTLIQKAYSFLAYLAIPVILIPYVVRMIWERTKK